ncbi:MAG: helix-turn-helix domain-containing protein [Flavobacteriales bacterium]
MNQMAEQASGGPADPVAASHQHFAPSPLLRPYIKCFHSLRIDNTGGVLPYERFTPDGCFEVNFNLADPPQRKEAVGVEQRLDPSYTVARSSQCYFMRPHGTLRLLGIRFHPWGLHPFTSLSPSEFADAAVPSAELFGADISALHERISKAATARDGIAEMERFLLSRLQTGRVDASMVDAAQRIQGSQGRLAQQEVFGTYGISQRRFQQRFKQHIGMSSKAFTRLTRFQQALRTLTADPKTASLDLAFDGMYYDQSHFVNEFRSFAGVNPSRYSSEAHPLNDAAVLDRA